MEVLIGHITFAGRLSVLRACYDFVRKDFKVAEPLWGSVTRELRTFKGLLILLEKRMDQQWSTDVWASDACETGHASVRGESPLETVQSVGAWQERWRFKVHRAPAGNSQEFERREVPKSGYSARDAALAAVLEFADIECDPETGKLS